MHFHPCGKGMTARGFFMIDIGRVFSTSWAMLRQRFWLLAGMWGVFFAIQLAGLFVLGILMAMVGVAGAAAGGGLDDPTAMAGLGVGVILLMVLFYGAYLVLVLAQQAAMVTLASPLEQPSFGGALNRGFKSALPFFGITIVLLLGYFAIGGVLGVLIGAAGMGSPDAAAMLGGVLLLLFLPVLIYFGCRFAVLVPVVAVDEVFNPIAAIRRSWNVTQGKVWRIFLCTLVFLLISAAVLGLPLLLIFGAAFGAADGAEPSAMVLLGPLLMLPLFIIYTIFASAYNAALHSEVTGGGAEAYEEVFA